MRLTQEWLKRTSVVDLCASEIHLSLVAVWFVHLVTVHSRQCLCIAGPVFSYIL